MQIKNLYVAYIILIVLISSIPIMDTTKAQQIPPWDNTWAYKQEIVLPISTETRSAKYQPIDITLEFPNPCWAKNEEEHSIRVIFQGGGSFLELESQIYELKYSDDAHIDSCNLVFLIPELQV